MKNKVRIFITSILLLCSTSVFAEGVDIVTLSVTAEGKTKDEAVMTALRNALEQAFGTFISSKTSIVNDELIKDEIVSVSSGNIRKYDVLSETVLQEGNIVVTVRADVSVAALTTFCESKGVEVEFKGGLFAVNIKLQQLYTKNEFEAIKNMCSIIDEILKTQICYDYQIGVSEPRSYLGGWELKYTINITPNNNMNNVNEIIRTTLTALTLSDTERKDYDAKNIRYGYVKFGNDEFYLRHKSSVRWLKDECESIDFVKYRCQIKNGLYTKILFSRFISKHEKMSDGWYAGLLTDHVPLFPYPEFEECKCWFSEVDFSIQTMSSSASKSWYCDIEKNCESKYRNLYSVSLTPVKSLKWAQTDEIRYSNHQFVYGTDIFPSLRMASLNRLNAIVTYTELLTLAGVESIQKITVEPFLRKDVERMFGVKTLEEMQEEILNKAEQLYNEGKYQEAIDLVESKKTDSNDKTINYILGASYYSLKEYEKAIDFFQIVLKNELTSNLKGDVYYWIGASYGWLDNYEGAMKYYRLSAELGNKDARKQLGLE